MSTRATSAWGSLLLLHEIFSAAVIEECPVVEFKISRLLWVFLFESLACSVEDINYLFAFTVAVTCSRRLNILIPLAVSKSSLCLHALFEFVTLSSTLVKLCVVLLNVILVESWRSNVDVILGFKFNQVIVISIHRDISTFYPLPRLISSRLKHLLRYFLSNLHDALFLIAAHTLALQKLLGQLNSHVFSFTDI